MRSAISFVCAALLVALTAMAAAAPPPPPPPPPQDMPEEIDGYSTYALRSNYYAWIAQRMAAAREEALSSAPFPAELSGRRYRMRTGPVIRVVNNEFGGEMFGFDFGITEWCLYDSPTRSCEWLARRVTVRSSASAAFLEAHFDPVRAVAYLQERGIAPAEVSAYAAQSYGLADPMADPLAYVEVRQATGTICPQIEEALAVAEERARELVMSADYDETAAPPPPPPHAYLAQITLPRWYARASDDASPQSYAEVTLSGRGDRRVSDLINSITEPLRACEPLN